MLRPAVSLFLKARSFCILPVMFPSSPPLLLLSALILRLHLTLLGTRPLARAPCKWFHECTCTFDWRARGQTHTHEFRMNAEATIFWSSFFQHLHVFTCSCVGLFVCSCVCLFMCSCVCVFVCLCVRLFMCLCVCVFFFCSCVHVFVTLRRFVKP